MIDTDKYEGHTPAPWRVEGELTEGDDNMGQSGDSTLSIHGDGLYIGEVGADYGIHETIANAQLIADAPLLLAEVKRLYDVINKAMQQHTVLHMRGELFESSCIDAEGQYESGHWEREEE